MRKLAIVLLITLTFPSLALAQVDRDFIARQREQFEKQRVQRTMILVQSIARDTSLQKELEVSEAQLERLEPLREKLNVEQAKLREWMMQSQVEASKLQRSGDSSATLTMMQEMFERQSELSNRFFTDAEKILLPHQIHRLTQIVRQEMFASVTGAGTFGIPLVVAEDLELTPAELDRLRETIETATAEYHEKVEALERETREKILQSIPQEKRKILHEMFGERYDRERERQIQLQRILSTRNRSEDDSR